MDKHPVVQDLEQRFCRRLGEHAKAIRDEFPSVKAEVWSWSTGSLTDWQGHDIGIDCQIADVPDDRPDNVALTISVMHLTTEPKFFGANVVWGHPSGTVEGELPGLDEAPYNETTVEIIDERLDELVAALRKALRRGKPSDRPEH